MKRSTLDTLSGVFVLIALVFLAWYSINLGKMDLFGGDYYQVFAAFNSAAGLKKGAVVALAGVEVGKVEDISLDQRGGKARVRLKIHSGIRLDDGVTASIRTGGLIGDKFISISPGGAGGAISPGGMIRVTESSVDFEQLISQLIQGKI
jgi:phospholipid/cholesterol/gamma-HCH transport system substrate-binding protein